MSGRGQRITPNGRLNRNRVTRPRGRPRRVVRDMTKAQSALATKNFVNRVFSNALNTQGVYTERRPTNLNIRKMFQMLRERANDIEQLREQGTHILIEVPVEGMGTVFRTFNNEYIRRGNTYIENVIAGLPVDERESDVIILAGSTDQGDTQRLRNRTGTVTVVRGRRAERNGGFFKYYNTSENDLSHLQIYTEEDLDNRNYNRDLCLLFAIHKYAEVRGIDIGKIYINPDYIRDGKVASCNMTKIAEANDINIRIFTINDDKRSNKSYPSVPVAGRPMIQICRLNGHYFPYFQKKDKQPLYGFSSSLFLVYHYFKRNLFQPIDYDRMEKEGYRFDEKIVEGTLSVGGDHFRDVKEYRDIQRDSFKVFFDTEKTTEGKRHEVYLAVARYISEETKSYKTFKGRESGLEFLEDLVRRVPRNLERARKPETKLEKSICYMLNMKKYAPPMNIDLVCHNLGYDIGILMPHGNRTSLWLGTLIKTKGGKLNYRDLTINMIDSNLHLRGKLSAMPKAVMLEMEGLKKEVMPYNLYTEETVKLETVLLQDALKNLSKSKHQEFLRVAEPYINGEVFRHMDYAEFYCRQDVRILSECFEEYNRLTMEGLGLSPYNYYTTASLSTAYFKKNSVFDGCKEVGGSTRAFIQESIDGGRVCSYRHKILNVFMNLLDIDARSLYPSAMKALGGYPIGEPKQLKDEQMDLETLRTFTAYFIRVRIKRYRKNTEFPILFTKVDPETGKRCDDGVKRYIFENPDNHSQVLNNISFEDLIYYNKLEPEDYEIVEGVYFDEGLNTHIKGCIENIYKMRLHYKELDSPLQAVFKLLMNSGYGSLCKKPNRLQCELRYFKDREARDEILISKAHVLEGYFELKEDKMMVEYRKQKDVHFSMVHIASLILAMSKRLMYRVMEIVYDLGGKVYYQDTDSLHIPQHLYHDICIEFKKRYGFDFDGDDLLQFHSDFEVSGSYNPIKQKTDEEIDNLKPFFGETDDKLEERKSELRKRDYSLKFIKEKTHYYHKYKFTNIEGKEEIHECYSVKEVPREAIHKYAIENNLTIEEVFDNLPSEWPEVDVPWVNDSINPEEYSVHLVALCAKSYTHKVRYLKPVNGKLIESFYDHYRMKGIPKEGVDEKCQLEDMTIEELYERMSLGEEMEFNLLAGERVSFECSQGLNYSTRTTFTRKVSVRGEIYEE